MDRVAWSLALVVSAAVVGACGGSADDEGLFSKNGGGSAGSSAGTGGSVSSGGIGGSSGGSQDAGLGGGPSGAGGGGAPGGGGSAGESGTSGASGGEGGSAGGPVDAGPEYTLQNVCQKLPGQRCAARKPCCETSVGYAEGECVARETAICNLMVSEVNAGTRTFNPDKIPACLAAVKPIIGKCVFSGEDYVAYLKMIMLCRAIFDSKAGPGSPCQEGSDCATPSIPHAWSYCSQSGSCVQTTFAQDGEACNQKYCDEGLTCYYAAYSSTGYCQPTTPQGSACSSTTQCGYGFYCPTSTNTCQPARAGGQSCSSDWHCKSLGCVSGTCTQQWSYVSSYTCGK
jgi:hypothetical protein